MLYERNSCVGCVSQTRRQQESTPNSAETEEWLTELLNDEMNK